MDEHPATAYVATYACGHSRRFEVANPADIPMLLALAADRKCPECEVHEYVQRIANENRRTGSWDTR